MHIAIIGGGPSALFICKRLAEQDYSNFTLTILEASGRLGAGMPYSAQGANLEHVTNVSANEIPEIFTSLLDWMLALPSLELEKYGLTRERLHEYRVVPRLLFGDYLSSQFDIALEELAKKGIKADIRLNTRVIDVQLEDGRVKIEAENKDYITADQIIICTGHRWPKREESKVENFFNSPYPPSKLNFVANHPVAVRGSSLTAIDAIKTLARANGHFETDEKGLSVFVAGTESPAFRIVMHSVHGLLPCVRFHLDEPLISGKDLITEEDMNVLMAEHDGFVPLDILFERNFKNPILSKRPVFYESIKDMNLEEFVDCMLSAREHHDPFVLFQKELEEAAISIAEHRSVYWKEMLASLSVALNYPAKHFSAEDMLRLKKSLMPLIAMVIAFIPQDSADELMALYRAGKLELISVSRESHVDASPAGGAVYVRPEDGDELRDTYPLFVDAIGQKHFNIDDFIFPSLVAAGTVSQARIPFRSADKARELADKKDIRITQIGGIHYMDVPGIAISDDFQVIDTSGKAAENIFIKAVPYISGHNPDYSGLDFCAEASARIVHHITRVTGA